jgi:hypothetical protein
MSHTFPREFYIPKQGDVTEIRDAESDAVAYSYGLAGALYAMAFHGKAATPDFHYRFKTEEARIAEIAKHAAGRRAHAAYQVRRKQERAATISRLDVGSILVASWGYDQTNLNWYQVTAKIGARTVELRPIAAESQDSGAMSGTASATKDAFTGEAFRRLVNGDGVRIDDCRRAYLWDGRPRYWSSYA